MRSMKTGGGLTKARGMTETQRLVWLMAHPVCVERGFLVHRIPWQRDTTYNDICRQYTNYVTIYMDNMDMPLLCSTSFRNDHQRKNAAQVERPVDPKWISHGI